MGISTAFSSAEFVLALAVGLVGGLVCVLWPESVRAFAARHHPDTADRFRDADAHRRFISFCGWAMLALAAGLSLARFLVER